jgi:hypothetical protein
MRTNLFSEYEFPNKAVRLIKKCALKQAFLSHSDSGLQGLLNMVQMQYMMVSFPCSSLEIIVLQPTRRRV